MNMLDLPDCVLYQVFIRFDALSLARSESVCHRMKELIRNIPSQLTKKINNAHIVFEKTEDHEFIVNRYVDAESKPKSYTAVEIEALPCLMHYLCFGEVAFKHLDSRILCNLLEIFLNRSELRCAISNPENMLFLSCGFEEICADTMKRFLLQAFRKDADGKNVIDKHFRMLHCTGLSDWPRDVILEPLAGKVNMVFSARSDVLELSFIDDAFLEKLQSAWIHTMKRLYFLGCSAAAISSQVLYSFMEFWARACLANKMSELPDRFTLRFSFPTPEETNVKITELKAVLKGRPLRFATVKMEDFQHFSGCWFQVTVPVGLSKTVDLMVILDW